MQTMQTTTQTNFVQLTGHLGKDVQLTQFENGKKRATFSMATTTFYKNYKGEDVSSTTWHNIVAWGNLAEKLSTLQKGAKVEVKGSINNRSYKDKEGNTKYITEVNCNEFNTANSESVI
jgi:single-strand DNA-binding protein